MKCQMCDKGTLKKGKIKEYSSGVYLGEFPADVCSSCGESFTDTETTRRIEAAAKRKGLFGMGAATKVMKSGNSLAIRIPKRIADHLLLRDGNEVYMRPSKDKLIIEHK